MKEPDWTEEKYSNIEYSRPMQQNDIVWVTKKTRGKFGKMNVAQPGDHGIVISTWTSSMGSRKIRILTRGLQEVATTSTCARIYAFINEEPSWEEVKLAWMDKTYIPIIVMREKKDRRRTRYRGGVIAFKDGAPDWVRTKDGRAVLVKAMGSDAPIWMSKDKVHPEDWERMLKEGSKRCHSLRVPEWIAKKGGVI
jgi:hypothetical protein